MKRKEPLSDAEIEQARQWQAEGVSLNQIARRLNTYSETLKRHFDPEYRARRNAEALAGYRKAKDASNGIAIGAVADRRKRDSPRYG